MEKIDEDRVAMAGRVVDFVAENQDTLAASDIATAQAGLVTTLYNQLAGARGTAAKRTQSLTAEGKQAKTDLLDLLPALLGPLSRAAARLQDNDLLATATLSNKQLRKLRPLALLGVAGAVVGSAARADVAPELAKQGLKATTLKPLRDVLARFEQAQPAVRKTIDARTLANAALDEQLGALMDALRELDQDMKAFKLIERPIYDGYVQMRKLIRSGGGAGSSADDAPTKTAASA